MGNTIVTILNYIKDNFNKPSFYITLIFIIVVGSFFYPTIESNIMYYYDMNKRIDLLDKFTKLDMDIINRNEVLQFEYNSLLENFENHRESESVKVVENENLKFGKFVSGAILPFIVLLYVPFMNTFKRTMDKFGAFIFMLIVTVALGFYGLLLPTFNSLIINYALPFGSELILLICAVIISNKKKL